MKKIRGYWRLFFDRCPGCGGNAPEMYNCKVCDWKHEKVRFPPPKEIKKLWWSRFCEQEKR